MLLPLDVWAHVFQYCDKQTLLCVRLLSSQFWGIADRQLNQHRRLGLLIRRDRRWSNKKIEIVKGIYVLNREEFEKCLDLYSKKRKRCHIQPYITQRGLTFMAWLKALDGMTQTSDQTTPIRWYFEWADQLSIDIIWSDWAHLYLYPHQIHETKPIGFSSPHKKT